MDGRCVSQTAKAGWSGAVRDGFGHGGSPCHAVLPGSQGCHQIEPASLHLRAHLMRRSGPFEFPGTDHRTSSPAALRPRSRASFVVSHATVSWHSFTLVVPTS